MSPPAPIPEHEFERFLRELGCEGKAKGSEYAVYRKSDGKLISGYAVSHGKGKREVLNVYKQNFVKALERSKSEEGTAIAAQTVSSPTTDEDDTWRGADWFKQQEQLQTEWNELQQPKEEQE